MWREGNAGTLAAGAHQDDACTVTLTLESLGPGTLSERYPPRVSETFPATTALSGTTHDVNAYFALVSAGATVQATCEVVDSHGLRAVRTGHCGP